MPALIDRLDAKTPKKILSLDGGGIRGALTLGYLKKIEDILKTKFSENKSFVLSDYFDLIGGTSTGAIIARSVYGSWREDIQREKKLVEPVANPSMVESRL